MKIRINKFFNKKEQKDKSIKNTPSKNKPKSAQASSLEAMSNYGRALLNLSFNGKDKQFDKRAIKHKLLNAKDNSKKPRFTLDEVDQLLSKLTCDNIDIFNQLLNMKDPNCGPRFNFYHIFWLMSDINSDNYDIFDLLSKDKIKGKGYRFDGFDIDKILTSISEDKKDILYLMLEQKDKAGKYIFSAAKYITDILDVTNEKNKDLVKSVIFAKNNEGEPRIRCDLLARLIQEAELKENTDILKILIDAKDEEGKYRFDDYLKIANLISNVTKENRDLFNTIFNANSSGKYRFDGYDIEIMFRYIINSNIRNDIVDKLLNSKNQNGEYRFDNNSIQSILEEITPKNADIFNKIADKKDDDGSFRFDKDIHTLLESVNYCEDISHNDFNLLMNILDKLLRSKDGKKYRFNGYEISQIMHNLDTKEQLETFDKLYNMKNKEGDFVFNGGKIYNILRNVNKSSLPRLNLLLNEVSGNGLKGFFVKYMMDSSRDIPINDFIYIYRMLGNEVIDKINLDDFKTITQLKYLVNKSNVDEIPQAHKIETLRKLISNSKDLFEIGSTTKKYFPLIPESRQEYCSILPAIVKSFGVQTNCLSDNEIQITIENIHKLSSILSALSDDEFKKLTISQEYTTDEFVKDTFNIVKDLKPLECQKVFDYFGFEFHSNDNGTPVDDKHCYSLSGYPYSLNIDKSDIGDKNTKETIEKLRPYVIKYSKNNKIQCDNPQIEDTLNNIINNLPELRIEIEREQHGTHDYDLFKHTLKVVQKISQNPEFNKLNESDKKAMLLAALFHDIKKPPKTVDKTHPQESAFDANYILRKLNLSKDEQVKIYSLIKNHEWFNHVNSAKKLPEAKNCLCSVAYDMQYDNLFEMSKIFTLADLKAVKSDDSFCERFSDDFIVKTTQIEEMIHELKMSAPFLPVTKFPKASVIKKAITKVNNPDGSANLKGIYQDKNGLVVVKYNEVENETWEKIGFEKGSISKGIKVNDINTGNIKFFVHGLDYANKLVNFDAFALIDSNALLSSSYAERAESKYRFFRQQGVILDADTQYVHGGGYSDSGSGYNKIIRLLKDEFIRCGANNNRRSYISNLIKKALNLSDEEYISFVEKNKNLSMTEIEPIKYTDTMIKELAQINSRTRRGGRNYNEIFISHPRVMGVYAYDPEDNVGDIMSFMDNQKDFLKKYALDHDFAFFVFGD